MTRAVESWHDDCFVDINIKKPNGGFFNKGQRRPHELVSDSFANGFVRAPFFVFELDFVTETLAQLYHQQGDISLAIKAYEKLILQNPSKKAYFASLIENLEKEKK